MNFAKHSFLRCYLEGWALWLGGNVFLGWFGYLRAMFARELRPNPWSFLENLADPTFLIANAMLVLLFAAFLIGRRKPTGNTE